jgi:hypothetical protein
MMVRKQLYIDADLDRDLKALAVRTGESEASHVRAALRAYVAARRAPRQHHPLDDVVGKYEGGPDDLAVNHDHYLYGVPKVE